MGKITIGMIVMFVFPCLVFSSEINSVLIVSIDALHPNALDEKTTQNIYDLMEQGVFTLDGNSTNPPLTLLSHAAMFSEIRPSEGGRQDNTWHPGEAGINNKTIFDDAKSKGFRTGFFYSKEKLGYLVTNAVDSYKMDPDFSVENAMDFFNKPDLKKFCFLHVSGLDLTGPVEGWMSQGYMEELFLIDEAIALLVKIVSSNKKYLIIITSDHAGHGTIHGSDHPDDTKLPLVMVSDTADLHRYQGIKYHVSELKSIIDMVLNF